MNKSLSISARHIWTNVALIVLLTIQIGCSALDNTSFSQSSSTRVSDIDNSDYVMIEMGELPVVLSVPHGGEKNIPNVSIRKTGTSEMDWNTFQLAKALQEKLLQKTGKRAFLVAAKVSRKYVDFNRSSDLAYETAEGKKLYDAYYQGLISSVKKIDGHPAAVLIDIHGQSADVKKIFRGTKNGMTSKNEAFYGNPNRLISSMLDKGLDVSPATVNETENANFNGGHTVRFFGSQNEIRINSIQMEFGYNYRRSPADIDRTANVLADSIISHIQAFPRNAN